MTNSPIPRVGGKKLLRKAICERFPDEHRFDRYVEVFGGGGWVLFYKDKHAKTEIYCVAFYSKNVDYLKKPLIYGQFRRT